MSMTERELEAEKLQSEEEIQGIEQRRAFLKAASKVAVTTTAVTLILSAGAIGNRAAAASPDGVDPELTNTDADNGELELLDDGITDPGDG